MIAADPVHDAKTTALLEQFRAAHASGHPIRLQKTTSNLFRKRERGGNLRLNVRAFDHVLHIDAEHRTADVEGMTTYETLVEATLRYGLLPEVVPQLKTITVGGAVSGLGIESSSFHYGLVHETVEEMEILTGRGEVVVCSRNENPDLFFGFPNSYGTLGYALRLKIRLVQAKPYVRLTHTRFSDAQSYLSRLEQLSDQASVDYLDGTIFGPEEMYLTQGVFSEESSSVSDYTYMQIYYRSIQKKSTDSLTAKDYIWRWDPDWFWCSKHFGVQNRAIRIFAKGALHSRTYQRLMRLSQRLLPPSSKLESVIQDVHVPVENAPAFLSFLFREIGITPIWVCPFRNSGESYDLCELTPRRLYINFGFWDFRPTTQESGYYNRRIESVAAELGGHKALYSTSYYDADTFWTLYDKARYQELKNIYDPDEVFPDLYSKCVGSEPLNRHA